MPTLAKLDAVPIAFVLLGVVIATTMPAVGAIWIATWIATLVLLVGSRHRLPRFAPRKAPAVLPNIDPSCVEGTPSGYGWWWMFLPFMLSTTIAPVALLDSKSLLVFAIPSILLLAAFVLMAHLHDRPSARVLARILAAAPGERIEGIVESVDGRFARHITWRTWTATRHGTATVEDVHGARVTVATVTHATHGCGTREEVRSRFTLATADAANRFTVLPDALEWAAVPAPMPPGTRPLRRVGAAEDATMRFFPVAGLELETIEVGDRVVAVATAPDVAARELRGRADAPVAVYAVRDGDPMRQLHRHANVRRAMLVGLTVCFAVITWVSWTTTTTAVEVVVARPQPH